MHTVDVLDGLIALIGGMIRFGWPNEYSCEWPDEKGFLA